MGTIDQREVSIRIVGSAGQGVKTGATLLGKALNRSGLFGTAHADVESRVRGGVNFFQFTVGRTPTQGIAGTADLAIALDQDALDTARNAVNEGGMILGPGSNLLDPMAAAREAGNPKTVAIVGAAAACALLGVARPIVDDLVTELFSQRGAEILGANLAACRVAYDALAGTSPLLPAAPTSDEDLDSTAPSERPAERLWVSGAEALSLGAVAGGVSFFSAYPMSPATGCLSSLATWADETGTTVVQVEDEIAAIAMVAGASYAGARAMTATSGGGFALMTEGLSLIGMIEAPAVIVLAQRPGPATGLATRTAQEDLLFAIHGGHGFFPRIILAPRDVADCFEVGARAFDLAERHQVPVFVMTDALLQDSSQTVESFDLDPLPRERYLLDGKTLEELSTYRRFALTETGISPLAAPGTSRHTVMVDSHIHDERGHLTECPANAARMNQKLLTKEQTIRGSAWLPEVDGPVDSAAMVVTWGSTWATTARTVQRFRRTGTAITHVNLRWLWPAPKEALCELFERCGRLVAIDHSTGSVFASYLESLTGFRPDSSITKLDGRPFTDEDLYDALAEEVGR